MSILIIGNGFDLAHHLPTQYSDFLDFVKACTEISMIIADPVEKILHDKLKPITGKK